MFEVKKKIQIRIIIKKNTFYQIFFKKGGFALPFEFSGILCLIIGTITIIRKQYYSIYYPNIV